MALPIIVVTLIGLFAGANIEQKHNVLPDNQPKQEKVITTSNINK